MPVFVITGSHPHQVHVIVCDGDIVVISICRHQVEGNAAFCGEADANAHVTIRSPVFLGVIATSPDSYYRTYNFGRQNHIAERSEKRYEFWRVEDTDSITDAEAGKNFIIELIAVRC